MVKNLPANAGDGSLIPRLVRSPGEENSNLLLGNPSWTEEPGRLLSVGLQKSQMQFRD